MNAKQRSENARKAANARRSKGVRPLPKRVRERILREVARMTPEEREQAAAEFMKRFSCGFRAKWGTDSDGKWGGVTTQVGRGFDGKWGTFRSAVVMVPHFVRNGAP